MLKLLLFCFVISASAFIYSDDLPLSIQQELGINKFSSRGGEFGSHIGGNYHSIHKVDFNQDSYEDIFFLVGEESVFNTFVYLGSSKGYTQIYKNTDHYSMIMDPEGDGRIEILDSVTQYSQCYDGKNWWQIQIPHKFFPEIQKEYIKLVGKNDSMNFKYGMPQIHPIFNLNITEIITIYRIEGSLLKDVTSEYLEHIKWRIKLLSKIHESQQGGCKKNIEKLIKMNSNLIKVNGSS